MTAGYLASRVIKLETRTILRIGAYLIGPLSAFWFINRVVALD